MTKRPLATRHRASDPGGRLYTFGQVTWVHCPQCDKAAKRSGHGVACAHCGYMTIQDTEPYSDKWVRFANSDQHCHNCRKPLEDKQRPNGKTIDGELFTRVKCPNCAESIDYRARPGWNPQARPDEPRLRKFLVAQVAGETLWVDNLAHLDALEEWLGASLRERPAQRGLTMMARLPRWMKASSNREKVLRALAQMRELAEKSGIDE